MSARPIGVILAGGQSLRMGEDKALLDVRGKRLIDIVYGRLAEQCCEVIISGSNDYGLGLRTVADLEDGPKGPVAALYALAMALQSEQGFLTVPVDCPMFPEDLTIRLVGEGSAVAASPKRIHPSLSYWSVPELKNAFEALDMTRSISLTRISEIVYARSEIWIDETLFLNINTPNDLSRYLTHFTGHYRG